MAVLCCVSCCVFMCCTDALVPFEYVQQLESVSNAATNAIGHIYAAPVLFEQDSSAVPGIVRATDYMWSALAAQNLNSWFGVGFPISNYRYVHLKTFGQALSLGVMSSRQAQEVTM